MTDINEKETIAYFINGIKKAKSSARELASLNSSRSWIDIRSILGQIEKNALKLFTDKPQTQLQTLVLANKIAAASDIPTDEPIIH